MKTRSEDDKETGYRKLWLPLVLVPLALCVLSLLAVAFYPPVTWLYEHRFLAEGFFEWWKYEVGRL